MLSRDCKCFAAMLAWSFRLLAFRTGSAERKAHDLIVVFESRFARSILGNSPAFFGAIFPTGAGFHPTAADHAAPSFRLAFIVFGLTLLPGRTMLHADAHLSKRNDTSRKVISLVPVRPAQAEPCTDAVPARGFMFPER